MKKYYLFISPRKIPLEFKVVNIFDDLQTGINHTRLNASQQYWVIEITRESPVLEDSIIHLDPKVDKVMTYSGEAGLGECKLISDAPTAIETNTDWLNRMHFLMGAEPNASFEKLRNADLPNDFSRRPMQEKWQYLYQLRMSSIFMEYPASSYQFFKALSDMADPAAKAQFHASKAMQFFQEEHLKPYCALFNTTPSQASTAEKATIDNWINYLTQQSPHFLQITPQERWENLYTNCHSLRFQALAKENRTLTCAFLQNLATAANAMEKLKASSTLSPYLSTDAQPPAPPAETNTNTNATQFSSKQ